MPNKHIQSNYQVFLTQTATSCFYFRWTPYGAHPTVPLLFCVKFDETIPFLLDQSVSPQILACISMLLQILTPHVLLGLDIFDLAIFHTIDVRKRVE